MADLGKYRKDTVFGIISALLKYNNGYDVIFMCGDEKYKAVSIIEDIATKTVIVDMKEVPQQDPADKCYYILNDFRDSPVDALKRFSLEDIVKSLDWALNRIIELEKDIDGSVNLDVSEGMNDE